MEGKRIGIVVGGAGAIPEATIRMAQEHDVELVRVEDIVFQFLLTNFSNTALVHPTCGFVKPEEMKD